MVPRKPSRLLACAALCAAGLLVPSAAHAAGDPYRSDQWGLDAVSAPEAWQQSTGTGVVVAVIDSGVQVDHPDLTDAVWTNPDETVNGVDDDGNGIVDDVHGADMVDSVGDVADQDGHGTHIAGIIAARAGNGVGVSGLAPQAQIMPVKVYGPDEPLTIAAVARGIRYAVDEGARIINLSMSGSVATTTMDEAVAYAEAHGVTIVASAGNAGSDNDAKPMYPASSDSPAVVSVTAVDEDRDIAGTNYGATSVDIAAPGDAILSTVEGSRYELRGGSSMAAPFVTGALALLTAARPDLDQTQLRDALLTSADRTSALSGKVATGSLDVGAAMHRIVEGSWGLKPVTLRLGRVRTVRQGYRSTLRWTAIDAETVAKWRVSVDGCRTLNLPGSGRSTKLRRLYSGRYRWTVTGFDADGVKLVSATSSLRVRRP